MGVGHHPALGALDYQGAARIAVEAIAGYSEAWLAPVDPETGSPIAPASVVAHGNIGGVVYYADAFLPVGKAGVPRDERVGFRFVRSVVLYARSAAVFDYVIYYLDVASLLGRVILALYPSIGGRPNQIIGDNQVVTFEYVDTVV